MWLLQLSAKNLMPTKYNLLIMTQKEINPLSSFSFTALYAPQVDLLLLMPGFKYSIASNLDLDIILQTFYIQQQNQFQNKSTLGFFRCRWSFGIKN